MLGLEKRRVETFHVKILSEGIIKERHYFILSSYLVTIFLILIKALCKYTSKICQVETKPVC